MSTKSFSLVALIVMVSLILILLNFTGVAKIVMSAIAVLLFIYLYSFGRYTERHKKRG